MTDSPLMREITRIIELGAEQLGIEADQFVAGIAAIVVLFFARFVLRRRKARKRREMIRKQTLEMMTTPEIDDVVRSVAADETTADFTIDTLGDPLSEEDAALVIDLTDSASMDEVPKPEPDQMTDDAMPHFDDATDTAAAELDDITIPRVGQAPSKKKSGLFSGPWLNRGKNTDTPIAQDGTNIKRAMRAVEDNSATEAEAAESVRLAEIERKMLALRELYEAGLIAPEIYVLKTREFAEESRRG